MIWTSRCTSVSSASAVPTRFRISSTRVSSRSACSASRCAVRSRTTLTKPTCCPPASTIGLISPTAQNAEPSLRTRQPSSPPPRPSRAASRISPASLPNDWSSGVKRQSRLRPRISSSFQPNRRAAPAFHVTARPCVSMLMIAVSTALSTICRHSAGDNSREPFRSSVVIRRAPCTRSMCSASVRTPPPPSSPSSRSERARPVRELRPSSSDRLHAGNRPPWLGAEPNAIAVVPRDVVDELFKRGVAAALCDAATRLKQPRATPGGARNRSGAADSPV